MIVGVDCATDSTRVGLALGAWRDGSVSVERVRMCGKGPPANIIVEWIGLDAPVLLALDAPLGWPAPMGDALASHAAGDNIPVRPNAMFRRETDRFVHEALGKMPLEVGADRIARTALAALNLVGELRQRLNRPTPLAWSPAELPEMSAIEVYPAATLVAHGIRAKGYKRPPDVIERHEIASALRDHLTMPGDITELTTHADALDAVVCLLAAKDFLMSNAVPPTDPTRARKEGWIWCAPRSS
jgi:predicted RNase H-like nuclease